MWGREAREENTRVCGVVVCMHPLLSQHIPDSTVVGDIPRRERVATHEYGWSGGDGRGGNTRTNTRVCGRGKEFLGGGGVN